MVAKRKLKPVQSRKAKATKAQQSEGLKEVCSAAVLTVFFVAFAGVSQGCGIKGKPQAPLIPVQLGHGQIPMRAANAKGARSLSGDELDDAQKGPLKTSERIPATSNE